MKKALLIADTRIALMGVLLSQIKLKSPNTFDEVIIYHKDPISINDKQAIGKLYPARYVEYKNAIIEKLCHSEIFKRFSLMAFCRYEMHRYLSDYDVVCWMDTDMVVKRPLDGLIHLVDQTGFAMLREDPVNKSFVHSDIFKTCFKPNVNNLESFNLDDYLYCSGLILISRKLKVPADFDQWCYQKTLEWSSLLYLPDQAVINAAIQHFNINVTPIPGREYGTYLDPMNQIQQSNLIHTWGLNKPWNDYYLERLCPEWNDAAVYWASIGGSTTTILNQKKPIISVIIPCYKPNIAEFNECLQSLITQKRNHWERFSNFEIIIVSDSSEDELKELIRNINDPRIKIIFNRNRLGIAASLNVGLKNALGKYIARADADDVCGSTRLYKQLEYLEHNPEIHCCITDYRYYGDMNEPRICMEGNDSVAWSLFTCPFNHPTVMIRKEFLFENNLFYDETRSHVEDWELWLRCFDKGMRVGCIHEFLYFHRWINQNSAGQTNKTVLMMQELTYLNFKKLGIELPQNILPYISPFQGKVLKKEILLKIKKYFTEALKLNEKLQVYNQDSLKFVFKLRIFEAATGILPFVTEEHYNAKLREQGVYPIYKYIYHCTFKSLSRKFKNALKPIIKPVEKIFIRPLIKPYLSQKQRMMNIYTRVERNEQLTNQCVYMLDKNTKMLNEVRDLINQLNKHQN